MAVPNETSPQQTSPPQGGALERAGALLQRQEYGEAQELLEQWLQPNRDDAGAWCYLGIALRQQSHFAAGVAAARRSVELAPDNAIFLSNLGSALRQSDRAETLAVHERAAQIAPQDVNIRLNRGIAFNEFGRREEALAEFDAALAVQPGNARVRVERAATLLQMGRYDEGLAEYEYRWQRGDLRMPDYKAPQWDGGDLAGKTILLWEDQGLGDTILCARYFKMVKDRGARVLLHCRPALHRLFEGCAGIDRLLSPGPVGERVHCHLPVISLPRLFSTRPGAIPPPPQFRTSAPPAGDVARLLALGADRFRVGIIWSGSKIFPNNQRRAVHASRFLPLAAIPGVQLFSLQKDEAEKQLLDVGGDGLIPRLGPHLNSFAETAAALSKLDLVIMTDSAVAHLAGSMGVPVWNLLTFTPYWIYGRTSEECPWYPSMRLFRQPRPGDWDSVFKAVAVELEKAVRAKRAGR